jgi:hypothetical protein
MEESNCTWPPNVEIPEILKEVPTILVPLMLPPVNSP